MAVGLRQSPWVAKLDGGAECDYCHHPFDSNKAIESDQHAPDCPWLAEHRKGDHRTYESNWTRATKQLLTE